jgi:hypothetical protein
VTEHVRRCLQPSPLRELPEEIDYRRIPHWAGFHRRGRH